MKQKIKVWDVPTRVFHWGLVAAISFMWFSAEQGGDWLVWHLRCGLLILGLLVFRLCWGFWGSDTARFSQFVKGPAQIVRYLKGEISENEQPGHNPLGALMVLALLAAAAVQVGSGLFAADENTFLHHGFLNHLVSSSTGSAARSLHIQLFDLLLILAVVHIVVVLLYQFVKKHNLITPMFTGYKELAGKLPALNFAGVGKLAAALAVALAAVALVLGLG